LENLGVSLNKTGHMNELDSLMRSISQDLDGNIRYQDFVRKLQIYGVEEMREE